MTPFNGLDVGCGKKIKKDRTCLSVVRINTHRARERSNIHLQTQDRVMKAITPQSNAATATDAVLQAATITAFPTQVLYSYYSYSYQVQ